MSRDRSLDDFLAGDEADGDERESPERADPTPTSGDAGADDDPDADAAADTDDARTDGADAAEGAASGLAVRPAESTMDWTPGGAPCEVCGASVERRWRDDGRLVCGDCKAW